ncbi:MAG: BlaI/MecI/CopY family transcriptional regulator [Candidatus Eremiobacteraeota bacterium]|nr:BlaI/MecI/CopY family transcriptional regulator [Candidatus Eremiobacteraeota bacterium]
MARKKSPTLTEAELRLMDVLWSRREATVSDVVDALGDPPLAYNTVLTTLRILDKKGYVQHAAVGRAFVYSPRVEREEARSNVIDYVVSRFFDNSPRDLMLKLLDTEGIDEREIRRVRALLDGASNERKTS